MLLIGNQQWDDGNIQMMKATINLKEYLRFIESKIDQIKIQWDKFYRPYNLNMNRLKDKYGDSVVGANPVSNDILNYLKGTAKLEENHFTQFLAKDLANTKILQRLDENSQIILSNIEEILMERLLPIMNNVFIHLEQIKSMQTSN